jgi:hypothetical protein
MRTVKYCLAATLAVGMLANVIATRAEDGDKPKHTIKEVMKAAHGGGKNSLAAKVASGSASDEEKKELVELYGDLGKNTPKKGTPDGWKEKTDAVVKAAKDVEAGKEGAGAALQKAINCKGCHSVYK